MPEINAVTLVLLAAGVVVCGGGWFLFRLSVRFVGFIAGAWVGYVLITLVSGVLPLGSMLSGIPGRVAAAVGIVLFGIVGAVLVRGLVKVVIFVSGALLGLLISVSVTGFPLSRFGTESFQIVVTDIPLWAFATALILGVIFVLFERCFIILYTAASGAYLISTTLGVPVFVFFAFFAAGSFLQFRLSKGEQVKNLEIITAEKADTPQRGRHSRTSLRL
jgi:hypothetical protein